MKRYTASRARERLADALDEAERGVPVIIERRGVRYRLSIESTKRKRTRSRSAIEILDPAVVQGAWSWDWTKSGLRFRAPRRR